MLGFCELIVIQIVLLVVQGLSYLAVQKHAKNIHDMERPVDKHIPLVPQAVFVYVLWFPLIAVFPLILYGFSEEDYMIYMTSIILDIIISLIIYKLYPTSFRRPELERKTFSEKVLAMLYKANYKGLNCMPSMHCSMSFIIFFAAAVCDAMNMWIKAMVCMLTLLIVVSTVLTKQHVLIDAVTAFILAIICRIAALVII